MKTAQNKISLGAHPLLYPEPVLLVASYDANGKPNVMTAAWGGICSSGPVSLTVSIRPERWSHAAILARKAFTVNIVTEEMVEAADYVGMASGRRFDKFPIAGFTPVRSEIVDAPYIAECPVILECTLSHTLELGVHTMMVGTIEDVKADESCLDPEKKHPDLARFAPLLFDPGARRYYGVGREIARAFHVGKPLLKE